MITRDVTRLEQGRDLVLAGRYLVVPGLDRNSQPVELPFRLSHECQHSGRDGPEVMVLELLTLRRLGSEQRALAGEQVGPPEEQLAIDQEVFLLWPNRGEHPRNTLIGPKDLENAKRLLRQRLHRPQERDLGVECFSRPGDKGRGNAQGDVVVTSHEKGRAGGVPRGIAPGFERCPEPTRGEAGSVRFALHQLRTGEGEHYTTGTVGRRQRIV